MNRRRSTVLALLVLCLASAARAEILFDFEGPYLVDPGHTIKDHEMVYDGQLWHALYIRGTEGASGTTSETALGHATSSDLSSWDIRTPVLVAGPEAWDGRNVWAPAVFPTPNDPTRWTMLYTGTNSTVVQRMGRAYTTNGALDHFEKYLTNPTLEPDSTVYDWSPSQSFSSFRDPFYFWDGAKHHVLQTAGLRDGQRRGVIYHATSTDLVNWTDVGVLAVNNNDALGTQWHDLESVQLIENGGEWYLFYTEQNVQGVQWLRSSQRDSGWDISSAQLLDPVGIAPEVTSIGGGSYLFTRHIAYAHNPDGPDAGLVSWTLRADTLRFNPGSGDPYIVYTQPFADWPVRTGSSFIAAPTFGDNSRERNAGDCGLHGHGYLSSRDFFAGPGSGFGMPGADLSVGATGTMKSPPFVISPEAVTMSLLVGGGPSADCFVALVRAADDSVLFSASGPGTEAMQTVIWDLDGLAGTSAYLWVEDASNLPGGWVTVDEVRLNPSPVASPIAPLAADRLLSAQPNPFNPRTRLRFILQERARVELQIHDLRGRRVRSVAAGVRDAGLHEIVWDGTDRSGARVASGVYLVRLVVEGRVADAKKVTLVR